MERTTPFINFATQVFIKLSHTFEEATETTFTYSTPVQISVIRIRIIFSFLLERKSNFCDAYENYIIQILVNENKERSGDKEKCLQNIVLYA